MYNIKIAMVKLEPTSMFFVNIMSNISHIISLNIQLTIACLQ